MDVLPGFFKGVEGAALKIKGCRSARNRARRRKHGSEDAFSPSRYTCSAVSPLGLGFHFKFCYVQSTTGCKAALLGGLCTWRYRLQRRAGGWSLLSRLLAPGQEVPVGAAVPCLGLSLTFHWGPGNTSSCVKRTRCPAEFADLKVTGGNDFKKYTIRARNFKGNV